MKYEYHWGTNAFDPNIVYGNGPGCCFYMDYKLPVPESVNAMALSYERVTPIVKRLLLQSLNRDCDGNLPNQEEQ